MYRVIYSLRLIKLRLKDISKNLKMLTQQINLDGMFSYIIYSDRYIDDTDDEVHYRFKTRTDGNDTCRSVAGCFTEKYIEPDMKAVIDRINEFESNN